MKNLKNLPKAAIQKLQNKLSKKQKKAVIATVSIIFAAVVIIGVVYMCFLNFGGSKTMIDKTEITEFNTSDDSLRVAVISDTQLPPTEKQLEEDNTYLVNLKKALTVIKNNDVDMILFAGDIGDLGTEFAFKTYQDAFDEVFGDNKPIIQNIMGNHDYWSKNIFTYRPHRSAYQRIIGSSPWTHYVVNGYHFIGASPDSGSMQRGYKYTAKWLDNELKKAAADSDGKPIFVITHNQPLNTSYGSEDWGDKYLGEVLSKYPNVIDFSGHVHYSLLDERSIWQGEYTVINTQSLSYTELEEGKENGTIPPDSDITPMGYIMDITDGSVTIHRINFADGNIGSEEKADDVWIFPLPYQNDGRYSFDSRSALNTPPVINENSTGTAELADDRIILSFPAAYDDDFVHSYKVVVDGEEEKLFFSDFYNGIDDMDKTVNLELENDGNAHSYKIYALDSWGAESKNYISISYGK